MSNSRITKSSVYKEGEYSLNDKFVGYNARTDKTKLTPSVLVPPSQNVVINTAGRVGLVKGYELDGTASTVIDSGILSNFDFKNFKGDVFNLRAGFMTSAANDGKLQFRWEDSVGTVYWIDLMTGLTSINLCFTEYWDTTALVKQCLWVDGSNNIYKWNGAVTTIDSGTPTTLTKQGTTTWQQEGFSSTGTIVIAGVEYTYTGGYTTTTLTGFTADMSAIVTGTETHQKPITTALSSMTSILATFGPTVIGCGRQNQVYLGSKKSNNLYISKVNDYTNYSFTSPVRLVGEGALISLNDPPEKFIPQEVHANDTAYDMYISEGRDQWAVIRSTLSSDNTSERLEHIVLKVSPLQGAQSEKLASKMKNHIMFIGHDNVAGFMGYMSYEYVPVITDFSYPIIDDMNSYDFTDGSIFFYRNYVYIAIPKHGLIRIFNMTDQSQQQYSTYNPIEQVNQSQPFFWEAPVKYPISGFYITKDGELGGHGYNTSESYLLFTGGDFNGQDIDANATFAFDDKGDRTTSKGSNEIWVEGYIKQNTDLSVTIAGDLDICQNTQTVVINGNDSQYVCYGNGGGSLGADNLGSKPLGGTFTNTNDLPAWFHVVRTYPQVPSYLEQISFTSKGVDLQWELITYGTNKKFTTEGNNHITV